jgi:hypothetical protein
MFFWEYKLEIKQQKIQLENVVVSIFFSKAK